MTTTATPSHVKAGTRTSFPKPSDIPVPAGAENWRELYPYYLVPQPGMEEKDDEKFWFCEYQHWPSVVKPFETIGVEYADKCLGQYNARHLMVPTAKGIEFRIHQGFVYNSPIAVPDEEVAARVPEFQARLAHYFQNWEPMLADWKKKVRATIDELESLEFQPLPEIVPMADITSGKGMDGSEVLLENYDRLINLAYRNWQYHFEFLNLGYIAYLDFFNFCKEVFPDIPDQSIATMVQGVDMELFKPDDELKELALLAVELGLQPHFANPDDAEATLAAIAGADGGERWLARWEEAKDPWFNFTTGNGFYGHDRYWIDHLDIPLNFIQDYIRRLDDGQIIKRPTEELVAERDRIIEEYRELLSAENAATFDAKRGLAATAYPYVENHNFYIEHWTMGVFWRKVRELSRLFHSLGFWPEEDDLLYLQRNEVRDAIFDYVTAHGIGSPDGPVGPVYWPKVVERRKGIVAALKTARPQPALNTPPASITEPFTRMLWGITTEQVESWLGADDTDDSGTLKGMAASAGVVEGVARVIFDADQLNEIQPGDILVAPVTAPSWGPVFGRLGAAVTDIGGMMSHAAIVCREYALPAVTGTGSASSVIKTGMRLRVDGTAGTVEILETV
ncbi:PEP-utilizing enzyme [Corynebacterium guangdongense]|uniref:Pyruvate,water dikinase n=1 Tax=Corynebacterium guangdongense TaxID=1783348 RepID=A0ABU1ZZ01_9CORY|nr:PEP-utilizing enzyme [Corynebacterium guangdongense]MDR7330070.1 pyruvate,water dikinase [Corynebacterium guangdongense]WJZ18628.1 Chondramide synthase cmdD [Corynebacterium guangdongense]